MFFKKDLGDVRKDFPILDKDIIYFDNSCMSLKPRAVIEKIKEYYEKYSACVGRSNHALARELENEMIKARESVRKFINAKSKDEIILTRNTTEGINLVANSIGLKSGDEVILSDKEHNSNLIPWLRMKEKTGIKVVICESNKDNTFNLDNFKKCFSSRTKLASIVHISNLDGVENPVEDIIKIAHSHKALVLIDAAQSVPHKEIDVRKLDADFLAFSGHKMCGPSGTGVLYGKMGNLEKLEQFIVGGETVIDSTYNSFKMEKIPNRFEAGLQDYAGIIGLGEACRYLMKISMKKIEEKERELNKIITEGLIGNEKIELIGPRDADKRAGIFSFNIKGIAPNNAAIILDKTRKIMVRSGAHCVHSWFNKHNSKGSIRASLYFYNTEEEARIFVDEVKKIVGMF